ncbi:MAG: hypothetical protein PVG49_11075 [Desulfobacteraceae bacterium]|jgi:hypothetical protein
MDTLNENPEILRIQETTRKLENTNQEVERLLDRLPLKNHREIARLDQLINELLRLTMVTPKTGIPPRIMVFFDNAKDKASHLRQRYNEALSKGILRGGEEIPP